MWFLVAVVGMVIGAMEVLEQPTTSARLDALFQPAKTSQKPLTASSEIQAIVVGPELPLQGEAPLEKKGLKQSGVAPPGIDLAHVTDNTHFRAEENEAWFALLDSLRKKTSLEIRADSQGAVTYAQLLSQPDVYRGKVVTVSGQVLRAEKLQTPANDMGISTYYRLVIRPAGGGVWPIIVYSLDLPDGLQVSDQLKVEASVDGVFFKNWSYAWEEGLGLAPVLLAKSIDLSSRAPATVSDSKQLHNSNAGPRVSVEESRGSFRELLELIDLGPGVLQEFSAGQSLSETDWNILAPLMKRLQQYHANLIDWTLKTSKLEDEAIGELLFVSGRVVEFEAVSVPAKFAPLLGVSEIYRCQLKRDEMQTVMIFTREIPSQWLGKPSLFEPVTSEAVLLRNSPGAPVMATNRLRWFPQQGVNEGKLLLAQEGVDAALWDAVQQRSEFVSPDASREAEAFYSVLAALAEIPAQRLSHQFTAVLERLATLTPDAIDNTQKQMAAAIADQARQGLSSVVPLFLSPEEQVGELVRLEGIARRAVRVVESAQPARDDSAGRFDYYELELFTPDSQNLPIVCCVKRVPEGFPLGDKIREQVRIEGVFFKSWLYRSRKLEDQGGETTRQRQRYTPVVLAGNVIWLRTVSHQSGWWALFAGIGFLVLLVIAGIHFVIHWNSDRSPRVSEDSIDFTNL